jgi:hypothetical protein
MKAPTSKLIKSLLTSGVLLLAFTLSAQYFPAKDEDCYPFIFRF